MKQTKLSGVTPTTRFMPRSSKLVHPNTWIWYSAKIIYSVRPYLVSNFHTEHHVFVCSKKYKSQIDGITEIFKDSTNNFNHNSA